VHAVHRNTRSMANPKCELVAAPQQPGSSAAIAIILSYPGKMRMGVTVKVEVRMRVGVRVRVRVRGESEGGGEGRGENERGVRDVMPPNRPRSDKISTSTGRNGITTASEARTQLAHCDWDTYRRVGSLGSM